MKRNYGIAGEAKNVLANAISDAYLRIRTRPNLRVIGKGVIIANITPAPTPIGTVVGAGYVAQGLVRNLFAEKAKVYSTPIEIPERCLNSYGFNLQKRKMPEWWEEFPDWARE